MISSTKLCKNSFSSQTMNVMSNEWKLCWWEWMYWKTRICTIFMMFPQPVSLQNLYILYGHNFNTESNVGILYWNFNAHKTIHLKTPKKVTISIELLIEIFKAQTLGTVLATVQGYIPATVQIDSSKAEHYEPFVPSFLWNILY